MVATTLPPLLAPRTALDGLDEDIERAMADWRVPGLAIAIVRGDEPVYLRGFGVRTPGGEPVDEHTLFGIASITKSFTAAAVGMLVEEGRLTWDEPIARHLPGFALHDPVSTARATLRDALAHRCGLPEFGGDHLSYGSTLERPEVVRRLRHLRPASELRARFGYTNVMYVVAGEAIAHATGAPWERFVAERVMAPLGMRRSTPHRGRPDDANVAMPHAHVDGAVREIPWHGWSDGPAGGITASAAELVPWIRLHLTTGWAGGAASRARPLVGSGVLHEMQAPQTVVRRDWGMEDLFPSTVLLAYGLGWMLHDYRGQRVIEHSGEIDGMRAQLGLLPALGLGVVVLSNLDEGMLTRELMLRVFDRFLGAPADWHAHFLHVARWRPPDDIEMGGGTEAAFTGEHPTTGPMPRPLAEYTGAYDDPFSGTARVVDEDGTLVLVYNPRFTGALEHVSGDAFVVRWRDPYLRSQGRSRLRFTIGRDGRVHGMHVRLLWNRAGFRRSGA